MCFLIVPLGRIREMSVIPAHISGESVTIGVSDLNQLVNSDAEGAEFG
jgi:hypothetical protein